jgi:hypothetical protein
MNITINLIATSDSVGRRQREAIEGPSRRQAVAMAAWRRELVAQARTAETAGDDDTAFERDCEAWDVENDLRRYGFDIETGRPVRA